MRKVIGFVAALVVLLVGGVFGVAAWSGRAVISRMESQTVDLQKALPALKVVEQKIERGLFQTTREFTLQIGCLPVEAQRQLGDAQAQKPKPIQAHFRDVIKHGPFPGGQLGVASIDSQLVSPPAWKEWNQKLTDGKPFLTMHTDVTFAGAFTSDVTLPAMHYADPAVGVFQSEPFAMRIRGKAGSTASSGGTYDVELNPFALKLSATNAPGVEMDVGRMIGRMEIGPRTDPTSWFGPSKSQGRYSSAKIILSASPDLKVDPVQITLENVDFRGDAKLENGLYSSASEVRAKGRINQVDVDKIEMRGSFQRLDGKTYQQIVTNLLDNAFSCDPVKSAQPPSLDAMQKEFASLLLHNPEYGIDMLAMEIDGQRGELSYRVGTQGIRSADLQQPMIALLLEKGFLRIALKIHQGLLARAVEKLDDVDTSAAGVPKMPKGQLAAMAQGMTDQFVEAGYIVREGESLKAQAAYENGNLTLNGKPFALPSFGP